MKCGAYHAAVVLDRHVAETTPPVETYETDASAMSEHAGRYRYLIDVPQVIYAQVLQELDHVDGLPGDVAARIAQMAAQLVTRQVMEHLGD